MITKIDRGHITVQLGEKTAIVQGEMFFPSEGKIGFVVYRGTIDYWEPKVNLSKISEVEVEEIIQDISSDFQKGGHTLEVEP